MCIRDRAAVTDGPDVLLMFRSSGVERDALRAAGRPFFAPPWRSDEVGLFLDDEVDWTEVAELVSDSFCVVAPKKLGVLVERPPGDNDPLS